MTITSPALHARLHRRMRRVAVFGVAAGMLAASSLVAASPASAEDAVDTTENGLVALFLSVGNSGVVAPDAALSTTVTVENASDDELSAGVLSLELNRTAFADSDALTAWLETGETPGSFESLIAETSTPLASGEAASSTLFVPSATLGSLPVGVYAIRTELNGATTGSVQDDSLTSREVSATSVLTVSAERTSQITVIVPITATPADGAMLTADELTVLTAEDGALTAQLDGVGGTTAVLAIDPSVPAAIRALGSAAPETALSWLIRLDALPNERFALQFGDADAAVQAQADLPELLTPGALSPYVDPANLVLPTPSPIATSTPTPTPTPTEPVLPTDEELTEISDALDGVLWPLGELDSEDLGAFADYLGGAATTIIPSTSVAGSTSAHGEVDGRQVLIVNAAASGAYSAAAAEPDARIREREIAAAAGHLALAGSASSHLIGLDRNETRTAAALRATISAASEAGEPIGIVELTQNTATSVTLNAASATDRAAELGTLLADEQEIRAFSSILEDPVVLTTPERIRLLRVIGVGTASEFDTAVATQRDRTIATLGSVGIQQPTPVQLFTAAAPLPVWVRNDLPWPVNVRLTAIPSDARLDVQPTNDALAQPASNTRVLVPVESRVGSGSLQVRFSLSSPTGVRIGSDQVANVTVRAEWEGIGLGLLAGLIVLLLAVGAVRTVRRRRRDAEEAADSDAVGDEQPAGKENDE